MPAHFIGLMSGTSLDGVDGVIADVDRTPLQVLAHASAGFDAGLRDELLALNTPGGADELHRAQLAANGRDAGVCRRRAAALAWSRGGGE